MKLTKLAPSMALSTLLVSTALSATPYPMDGRGYPGPYYRAPHAMPQTSPWHQPAPPFVERQAPSPAPAQIIREGLAKLDTFLSSGEARNPGAVHAYLALEIAPYFDLEYMTRWAAGPIYRRLSPEQRATLAEGLGQLFFRNMATHLAGYQGGEIRYLPTNNPGGRETTVRVQVGGVEQAPVRLDFRMYRGDDGWKVFDIQANGRSAVVHYRNLIANLSRHGGIQGMLNQITTL